MVALAFAFFAAGCSTGITPIAQTNARIKENAAVFAKMNSEQQGKIRGGMIEVGDTPEAVYMALGKPKNVVASADGQKFMWRYLEYSNSANASKLTLVNPNSSRRYKMAMTSANTPYHGSPGGAGAPESFGFGAGSLSTVTELPDLDATTVYVFFYQGKVMGIKTDRADSQPLEYFVNHG